MENSVPASTAPAMGSNTARRCFWRWIRPLSTSCGQANATAKPPGGSSPAITQDVGSRQRCTAFNPSTNGWLYETKTGKPSKTSSLPSRKTAHGEPRRGGVTAATQMHRRADQETWLRRTGCGPPSRVRPNRPCRRRSLRRSRDDDLPIAGADAGCSVAASG